MQALSIFRGLAATAPASAYLLYRALSCSEFKDESINVPEYPALKDKSARVLQHFFQRIVDKSKTKKAMEGFNLKITGEVKNDFTLLSVRTEDYSAEYLVKQGKLQTSLRIPVDNQPAPSKIQFRVGHYYQRGFTFVRRVFEFDSTKDADRWQLLCPDIYGFSGHLCVKFTAISIPGGHVDQDLVTDSSKEPPVPGKWVSKYETVKARPSLYQRVCHSGLRIAIAGVVAFATTAIWRRTENHSKSTYYLGSTY